MGWNGWVNQGGANLFAAPISFRDRMFLFFQTITPGITIFSSNDGKSWSPFSSFGGVTDARLAPVVFDNKLFVFIKGKGDEGIYFATSSDALNWSPPGHILGATDAAVAPVAFNGRLHIFCKGKDDNGIYQASSADGANWGSSWAKLPGTTDVALAPVVLGQTLYVFSKGINDQHIYMCSSTDAANWSGPTMFTTATTDAAVGAAVVRKDLYLVAKGVNDKRIYMNSTTLLDGGIDSAHWSGWYEVPPTSFTPKNDVPPSPSKEVTNITSLSIAGAPMMLTFKGEPFLFAYGADGNLYSQSYAHYRLPFENDGQWALQTGNWDDPGGGHPAGQAYAFDFIHPRGGKVFAARDGKVVGADGSQTCNSWNVTDPNDPCYGNLGNWIMIRHCDGTAAAYDHLMHNSVVVKAGDMVKQGQQIALSGNTGNSSQPHLHIDCRQYWNSPTDKGPTIPICFIDGHHSRPWRPRDNEALAPTPVPADIPG